MQKSIYVFALLKEIGKGRGESFAQQICDCAYGQGNTIVLMWKFAGAKDISISNAHKFKDQLGINWGVPEKTWEGVLPNGESVAALFWVR